MDQKQMMDEAKSLYLRCQFDQAYLLFQKLAQKGDGEAMYFLGEYYAQGYGHIRQDLKKSGEWRKKGAARGNPLALLNTVYLIEGREAERQRAAAAVFPQIQAMAEEGDLFAQNELPDMYLYGIGTARSVDMAVHWLETGARRGFWRPLNKLGEIYFYGEGVPADRDKAKRYFEQAAALGYGDAEANLAMLCYTGEKPQMTRAVSLLRRAFAHGALHDQDVAHILGMFISGGEGVPKDEAEGFAWMRRAAEMGSVSGMNSLAIYYDEGIGTPKDREKSLYWCRKAADLGHVEAAVQCGIFLREDGELEEARRYFQKAADQGNAMGQTWLASCYLYGLGAEENKEEARKWLEAAAAQHEEDAVRLLKEEFGIEYGEKSKG